ncbi:MAG: AraC family transcriptional regulator [Endozoicomonas sp.]|uniref:AraC family transcriptional regulator n=1 Tax=Endozoicomonas sp. TaxID=1892382 RepID=UPI003D9AEF40
MTIVERSENASTLNSWALPLVDALREQGCPVEAMLEEAGIHPDLLRRAGSRIPVDSMTLLWKAAARETDNPAIGLSVMDHVNTSHLFAFSYVVQTSANIREALEFIARYSAVISTAVTVEMQETHDYVELLYRVPEHLPAPSYEAMDAFAGVTLMRMTKNLNVSLSQVHYVALPRPTPMDPTLWTSKLPCPVRFDSDFLRLSFHREILEYSIPTASADIANANKEILSRYLEEMSRDFLPRVRGHITHMLVAGEPTLEAVAQLLNMSPRNLHRKLQAENTSFRELLDEIRKKRALSEISQPGKPLTQIAHELGFHDSSSFSRAFKRWTGETPKKYREEQLLQKQK